VGQAIRRLLEASALRRSGRGRAPRPPAPDRAPSRESVGSWLAGQRRLRGLSLEDVAGLTRIPRRSLERLEAGAFDGNPDGFARGFVRAVAEAIGVDPEEAGARLLDEVRPERARRALPWRPVALGILAAVLAFFAVRTILAFARAPAPAAVARAPGLARRDYVRELAARAGPAPTSPAPRPPAPASEAAPAPLPSPPAPAAP
jgi:transcriptional regulator with XRE-family HTH domain